VVVDLLIAMGYGGGDAAMGRVTGRSGDGGIDGTIKEDTLGLDEVYIQAKRYAADNTIGAKDLRNFAGALDAAGTTKGVFVTTATFTSAAKDYVKRSPKRIVLIDGEELARLMVEYDIGVRTRIRHAIKRIDEDYFEQEAL
jgi:restriction system protein